MKLLTVLAATAAAAAVPAAISLPAGARHGGADSGTTIATCLQAHGLAGAPSGADGLALKRWVAAHSGNPAVAACVPHAGAPSGLVSCLRQHGLNPPSDPVRLKVWMAPQARTRAGKVAIGACGVSFDPPRSGAPGDPKVRAALKRCGAAAPRRGAAPK